MMKTDFFSNYLKHRRAILIAVVFSIFMHVLVISLIIRYNVYFSVKAPFFFKKESVHRFTFNKVVWIEEDKTPFIKQAVQSKIVGMDEVKLETLSPDKEIKEPPEIEDKMKKVRVDSSTVNCKGDISAEVQINSIEPLMIKERIISDEKSFSPRKILPLHVTVTSMEVDVKLPVSETVTGRLDTKQDLLTTGKMTGEFKPLHTAILDKVEIYIKDKMPIYAKTPEAVETEKVPFVAIDNFAEISTEVYTPMDEKYKYIKINMKSKGENILPPLPWDLLMVQDCSASVSEQRLRFCKKGWLEILKFIKGSTDIRFTVISFRDSLTMCFPKPVVASSENIAIAERFINNMHVAGETDIYGSLNALLKFVEAEDRPVIAIVVTDGLPTVGMVESSEIIGKFSAANAGRMSVFTLGTASHSNGFLLEFLGYANRGSGEVVKSGRWDIPEKMVKIFNFVRYPVLNDLKVIWSSATPVEVYPLLTPNLYLKEGVTFYARADKVLTNIIFQVTGNARGKKYSMLCNVDITKDFFTQEIRREWATLKIYSLIPLLNSHRDKILSEITETSTRYRIKTPYPGFVK